MNYHLELTSDQTEELEKLAALGYTAREIAICLMESPQRAEQFEQAAKDPQSRISWHINRGILLSRSREEKTLLSNAEGGNITASQHLHKVRRTRGWQISKLDVFGGFEDRKLVQKLEDYIAGGSINDLSQEEAIYLDALMIMNELGRKYGRRNAVRFYTKEPFNLSYKRASEMYDESVNLFYTDRNIEKKAIRHKYAEQLEEAAAVVLSQATSSRDFEVYGNMLIQAAKLQGLDKPDVEKLPVDVYQKPLRLLSLNTETIGLPKIDRQAIANQIEALEIPERDKIRLRKDALIEPFNIEETLNELEEESKSEE